MSNRKRISNPEEVATIQNPMWEVANDSSNTGCNYVQADDVSPDLDTLRKNVSARKTKSVAKKTVGFSEDAVFSSSRNATKSAATLVRMVSKNPSDSTFGSKTVVVQDGRVLGESG